jgi:hypothetical protein
LLVDIDQLGVVQPLGGFHGTHKPAATGICGWHGRKNRPPRLAALESSFFELHGISFFECCCPIPACTQVRRLAQAMQAVIKKATASCEKWPSHIKQPVKPW